MRRRNREEKVKLEIVEENKELVEENAILFEDTKEIITEKLLNEKYTELKKNTNILKNEMAFANVYCFAFNLDAEFDNSFKDLKFGLDIVTKNIAEIDNHFSVINDYGFENSDDVVSIVNDHLNISLALQRNLIFGFKEIKDVYFAKMSMTSVAATIKKTSDELNELASKIDLKLKANGESLDKAFEYVYYRSGDMIVKLVDKLVVATKSLNRRNNLDIYHRGYFLPSDYVITLEIKEWTALYNKIKFVFKMLNENETDSYETLKLSFEDFEVNYLIILLHEEKEKMKNKNN